MLRILWAADRPLLPGEINEQLDGGYAYTSIATILTRKVALHASPPTVAGFSGLGVAARMGALLQPPVPTPHRGHLVGLWSSLAATAGFSVYQLHHLERLLTALCPH